MIVPGQFGPVRTFRLARSLWGRGRYFTAAYYLDGIVVDTGCAYTASELAEGLSLNPVHTIVNTHSHEDHIAGNAALLSRSGVRAFAHPVACQRMAQPEKMKLRPYQLVMWGRPAPSSASAIGDWIESEHYKLQVIPSPGHSPDHICFYEPNEGWLFTGDAYVGGKDRGIRADYNIWQIILSLKKLARLDAQVIFPGSGNVRMHAIEALQEKIEYLEATGDRVLKLRQRGWSYSRIRRAVFGSMGAMVFITLGNFSGWHLVRSYVEDLPEPKTP